MISCDIDMEVESCVYKLYYGDKYIIVKGKTLSGSIFLIEKGYAYFIAGGGGYGHKSTGEGHKEGEGKNTYYYKFYSYIKHNPNLNFSIQVLFESDNGYQLLKREQQELQKSFYDKNCLNNNLEAYIPKFSKSTLTYGWIRPAHVLNFKKFLKRL